MRYFFLAIAFSALLASCKLMKKEEEKNNITNNKNQKSMMNRFKRVEWAHSTNVYEVNVRQYTAEGTFNAFAKELPRLKDMGVEVIWFMPVTPISIKNRKGTLGSYYACSSYVTTNTEFGTIEEFKSLVFQIHQLDKQHRCQIQI